MKSNKIILALEKTLNMQSLSSDEVSVLKKHLEILKADFDLVDQVIVAEDRTLVIANSASAIFGKVFHLQSGDLIEQWRKKSN